MCSRNHVLPAGRSAPLLLLLIPLVLALLGLPVSVHAQADWTIVGEMTVEPGQAIAVPSGGRIYLIATRVPGEVAPGTHLMFDPATNMWHEAATLPAARSGGASSELGDPLVQAGGECRPVGPPATFPQVETWDPVAETWISLRPPSDVRPAFSAAAGAESVSVIGGQTGCGGAGSPRDGRSLPIP